MICKNEINTIEAQHSKAEKDGEAIEASSQQDVTKSKVEENLVLSVDDKDEQTLASCIGDNNASKEHFSTFEKGELNDEEQVVTNVDNVEEEMLDVSNKRQHSKAEEYIENSYKEDVTLKKLEESPDQIVDNKNVQTPVLEYLACKTISAGHNNNNEVCLKDNKEVCKTQENSKSSEINFYKDVEIPEIIVSNCEEHAPEEIETEVVMQLASNDYNDLGRSDDVYPQNQTNVNEGPH